MGPIPSRNRQAHCRARRHWLSDMRPITRARILGRSSGHAVVLRGLRRTAFLPLTRSFPAALRWRWRKNSGPANPRKIDDAMSKRNLPIGRWSRRLLAGAALLSAAASVAGPVEAATARLRWLPSSSQISGYRIYVRSAGSTYGSATAIWSGNPTPGADGAATTQVTYTPSPSGVNYFTVVAVGSASGMESGLAQELPIGTPNPCRADACSTKTACDFSQRADGYACDDASFCNGAEVCQTGSCVSTGARSCSDAIDCTVDACDESADRCTHTGPPGCCLACDTDDPCLADACAIGDCSGGPGKEITVNRVRLLNKASGIKLAAKGTFYLDAPADPTVSGVEIRLMAPDGTELFKSIVPSSEVHAGSQPGRYRFAATRAQSEVLQNGVTRVDFRVKGPRWSMTLKAETLALADAMAEPTLTWVVRMGTTCARHLHMECNQSAAKSVCR